MALSASLDGSITNVRARLPYTVTTSATVYAGGLAQLTTGKVGPAVGGTSTKIVGRFTQDIISAAAGTETTIEEGDMVLNQDATNPCVAANIGSQVYATADGTIGNAVGSTNAKAGILLALIGTTQVRVRVTQEANL
jgi:hypothetical protein